MPSFLPRLGCAASHAYETRLLFGALYRAVPVPDLFGPVWTWQRVADECDPRKEHG